MNYTETEILSKTKQILSDLNPRFYEHETIQNARFDKEEELGHGPEKGKKKPCWIVAITESVFDSMKFLTISDDNGEPLYINNGQGVIEIEKSVEGKYVRKNN